MTHDSINIVQRRRGRRASEARARRSGVRMGGVGLGIIVSLVLALGILFAGLTYADLTRDLPNIDILPGLLNPPDGLLLQPTRVYDRTDQHLLMTFAPRDVPRRYLPLNPQAPQHLPDFLAQATVALLDPGFWSEPGFAAAGWQDPRSHPTLAQQLASDLLLYAEPSSLRRALRERFLAAQITTKFGRNQILEWYLNSADYGNYAFGVDAAAQLYFGKSASDLTPAESAILAAVSQAPNLNPLDAKEIALQRGRTTIQLMQALNLITSGDAQAALSDSPAPLSTSMSGQENALPAFINLALNQLDGSFSRIRIEHGGLVITTTEDFDLQQQTICATLVFTARLAGAPDPSGTCTTANSLPPLPPNSAVSDPSASALVYDPESGQILAVVGETLQGRETTLLAAHDPGTLLTPFVYLAAFTRGLSPASLVWDIPPAGNDNAAAGTYHGPVRIRIALANDYAASAQAITDQIGSDTINRIESSFGLGQTRATLLDMATAYGIFAAQGVRYGQPGPSAVLRVEGVDHFLWLDGTDPQAQPIVTPQLAYLMNNVLSDESARWISLGHPNSLEIGRPAGVKLGQTASGQDAWTVGYTPTRVVAVWIGTHGSGTAHASARISAGLWGVLMHSALGTSAPDGWSAPAGITQLNVCDPSGLLPTKDCPSVVSEVFLNGNEPVQTDDLFRAYEINRETGYLATVFTPPQLVVSKVFMMIPPEAQAWAKSANIPSAPSSYDAIQSAQVNPDVHISSPVMFADVSGQLQLIGSAAGSNFDHYRILEGQGLNPQQWTQIGTDSTKSITDGILGTWDTTGLSGLYAIQLQVIRTDQRVDTANIQVNVTSK